MKQRLFFPLLLVLAVVWIAGSPARAASVPGRTDLSEGSLPPDIERIRKRGRLIVALRTDTGPPLCAVDDAGRPRGIEVDIARSLAARLGVELEINDEAVTPEDALRLVRRRRVDMAIANLVHTADRTLATPFGQPYLISHASIIACDTAISADGGFIDSAQVLSRLNSPDKRIGIQEGAYYNKLIDEIVPLATVVPLPGDWSHAEQAFFSDDLDAMMVEDLRSVILFRRFPELTVYNSVFILKDREEHIAPAFHWQDAHLRLWYDAWVREWRPKPYRVADLLEEFPELVAAPDRREK